MATQHDDSMPVTASSSLLLHQDVPTSLRMSGWMELPHFMPSTSDVLPATRIIRSNAERQRDYRLRKAEKKRGTALQRTGLAKTKAQRQREYRQRKAEIKRGTAVQRTSLAKTNAERQREYRQRKAVKLTLASDALHSIVCKDQLEQLPGFLQDQYCESVPLTISESLTIHQDVSVPSTVQFIWHTKWFLSIKRFKKIFTDNDFGHACSVCDRLWFKNDLRDINSKQLQVISEWFVKENLQLHTEEYKVVCSTCKASLNKGSMPLLAKVNGFSYPEIPPGLPLLDPISERLISPRLPFMQVRRLRHDSPYGIIGQAINMPSADEMVKCLPRQLDEDIVINVNIQRNLAHKSDYVSGYVSKNTVKAWLGVLQKSTLYNLYNINVDLSRLELPTPLANDIHDDSLHRIENIAADNTPESEVLAARQHTMMWNKEDTLFIVRGHRTTPLNIFYDHHAEELSFPSVYYGEPRHFKLQVPATPYMITTSELRRCDRRGATPQKILYMAMKILRLRMMEGISNTLYGLTATDAVTRCMLEDKEFLNACLQENIAFMKTVPNSIQYWRELKQDLFAMIRKLGRPTIFLTISASEIHWANLLNVLNRLSNKYPGKVAEDLDISQRCSLVSDDPVVCCIYFYKLIGSLMKMLKAKTRFNPFGRYFVKDHFIHFEFEHQSPQAHIVMWLNDDPKETLSDNMPKTIELIEQLSSVARVDVPSDAVYANQIHKHTFTCANQGEAGCRLGIPYWPMPSTRVLVPLSETDGCRKNLEIMAKELRTCLNQRKYSFMDEFLRDHSLSFDAYLDVIRSTLRKPTLVSKRNFNEIMTNTFNPYIAGELNSNAHIQFVLDDYSCVQYVVECMNKPARGMGILYRELFKIIQEHPERDYTGELNALSVKLLNADEMSTQEAAWYLLRQPMSETSREIVYVPTVRQSERQRCRKRRKQMDREGLDADSTDVWMKNIVQRYEQRPFSLETVCLAEFASWYGDTRDLNENEDNMPVNNNKDSEDMNEVNDAPSVSHPGTTSTSRQYRRRQIERVVRYRRYDVDDTVNYQREMVLLYLPFRNETSDILDCDKFLHLFDDNKDIIMERHHLYETNLNIDKAMAELEAVSTLREDVSEAP